MQQIKATEEKSDWQNSSSEKIYERKITCKIFKSKSKFSNSNKTNEEKSDSQRSDNIDFK